MGDQGIRHDPAGPCQSHGAEKRWKRWLAWTTRCRLEPVKKVAETIKQHLCGILYTIILDGRQRRRRKYRRPHQTDQSTQLRVPQHGALPQRHLLSSR
ncbi:MAG: hypothetical protein EPN74_17090 [Rhodanobacter sp.]|nr:MAG: hypothetical protein EPN74_17090 [Rhodanobacter sp.]